jgi:two-component system, chemotaxis family, protein-glutamate methylesterase/glutaminase
MNVNRWNGVERRAEPRRPSPRSFELVVIGCSLGGMHALHTVLSSLGDDFSVPIAVVQHRHKRSNENLPEYFRRVTHLCVVDALDKQWIKPQCVYFAPADYHLLVERGAFSLSVDDVVAYSRPSIDVLFESAADAYGEHVAGVILTGMNSDGARGARRVRHRGGFVVAQDPRTAEAPTMPQAAIDAGAVDRILPLERIGPFLAELCRNAAIVNAHRP